MKSGRTARTKGMKTVASETPRSSAAQESDRADEQDARCEQQSAAGDAGVLHDVGDLPCLALSLELVEKSEGRSDGRAERPMTGNVWLPGGQTVNGVRTFGI
jgi:hypothetical protein